MRGKHCALSVKVETYSKCSPFPYKEQSINIHFIFLKDLTHTSFTTPITTAFLWTFGLFWFHTKRSRLRAASVCRRHLWSLAGTAKTRQHCQHALDSVSVSVVVPSWPPFYHTCTASFSHSRYPPFSPASSCLASFCQYVWHHLCYLFFLSCPFFLTLLPPLFSACSCGRYVGGCVAAHCLQFWWISICYDQCLHVILSAVARNSQWLSLLFRVMLSYRVTSGGSNMLPCFFHFYSAFNHAW